MQQQLGAAEMAQELVTETRAFRGALDEAWNVRGDEARGRTDAHHTERRVECRERIVCHFRTGARHGAKKRGLARVRQAEQPDVGEDPQLERKHAALPRLTPRELARRAVHTRLEMKIAESAPAALC